MGTQKKKAFAEAAKTMKTAAASRGTPFCRALTRYK
jgi:hypothetical protein